MLMFFLLKENVQIDTMDLCGTVELAWLRQFVVGFGLCMIYWQKQDHFFLSPDTVCTVYYVPVVNLQSLLQAWQ